MRILLITQLWPDPPLSGESVITYNLIKELSNRHEFYIFSIVTEEMSMFREIKTIKMWEIIKVKIRKNIFEYILTTLLKRYPYGICLKYREGIGEKLRRKIEEIRPDIIIVCSLGLAIYYKFLPINIPKQLLATDSLPLIMKRLAKREKNLIKKLHYMIYYKKAINYESKVYEFFDSVIYVSDIDANEARKVSPKIKVDVINNGVDIEKFNLMNIEKIPYSIGFTGNLGYIPNEEAAYTLCTKIYPKLREKFPETKVYIIGVNPSMRLKRLHDGRHIFITGYVDNIVEYLNRIEIYCSYLEAGGGIKNKILEAMSVGLPIVGTKYSFEGIEGEDGKHFIIKDNIEDMITEIQSLFEDKNKCLYISNNARKLVEEKYSWKTKAAQYERLWEKLVRRK